jgi:hypothetical protein
VGSDMVECVSVVLRLCGLERPDFQEGTRTISFDNTSESQLKTNIVRDIEKSRSRPVRHPGRLTLLEVGIGFCILMKVVEEVAQQREEVDLEIDREAAAVAGSAGEACLDKHHFHHRVVVAGNSVEGVRNSVAVVLLRVPSWVVVLHLVPSLAVDHLHVPS